MGKFIASGFFVLVFHLVATEALQCLSCDHVPESRDCRRLVTCGSHEICYVQRLIGSNLKQYYKLGCTDKNVCLQEQASMFVMGKRDTSDVTIPRDIRHKAKRDTNDDMVLCLQCCEGTDGCNKNLCGAAPSSNRRCLTCKDVLDAKDCESLSECGRDEYCFVHKGINPNIASFEVRYHMGCMGLLQCNALTTIYPTSCAKCCNQTDLCNYAACDGWTPQGPSGTTPSTLPPHTTPTKPTTTVTPPPQVVINGPDKGKYMNNTQLSCVSVPPAQTYYWKFNGTQSLPQGVQTQQSPTNAGSVAGIETLTIPSLTEKSTGTYTCVAIINGHIVEESHSINIIEDIFQVGQERRQRLATNARDRHRTYPPKGYFKHAHILTQTMNSILSGLKFAYYKGRYNVINNHIEVKYLTDQESPTVQIVKPPVANSFALQCKSTGYPVPHIEWDFLPSGIGSHGIPPGVQFQDQGTQSTLFVNQYRPNEHDGIWYCKAKNSQGSAITNVHIP